MKFRLLLVAFFVLLMGTFCSYGQIAAWDFFGENTANATSTAEVYNVNMDASSNITRGATAGANAASNSFRTVGFKNDGIATSNTDYFQITLSAATGYTLSLSTIDARFAGTGSYCVSPGVSNQFAYSLDGSTFTLISTSQALIGSPATLTQINLSGISALQNVPDTTIITIRYYASGQTGTGGWGFTSPSAGAYGLAIGGALNNAAITTRQNGDWYDGNTWTGLVVPTSAQNVIINHAVTNTTTFPANITRDLGKTTTINSGGSVSPGAFTFTNAGDVTINNGGAMTIAAAATNSGTTTVNAGGTLNVGATYTNSGSTSVAGTFQVNQGGSVATNAITYTGVTNTLVLNGSSGLLGVSTPVNFWPTSSSPYNVTVQGTGAQINNIVGTVAGTLTVNSQLNCSVASGLTVSGTALVNSQLNVATASGLFISGTLQMNSTGFINNNSPIYTNSSLLKYNIGGAFNRSLEWTSDIATIGTTPGYPNNVQLSNSTTLNYYNATNNGPKGMNGSLTIDALSTLSFGATSTAGALTVTGNVANAGTLSLGAAVGDDIKTAGNFSNTGTFTGNNRAIWFIKAGTQTVSSTTVPFVIPYVVTANGTNVQMLCSITITAPTNGNAIDFTNAADVIDLNGNALIVGTSGVNSIINGSGSFKGSTTSDLTLNGGNGSIGTIKLVTDFNLRNFTLNRQALNIGCVMGSAVTVNGALTLTNGIIDLGNNAMTIGSAGTISNASSSNFIIADVGNGSSASLRKSFTAAGTFAFPIGDRAASADGMQYSPVSVTFTGGSYAGFAGFAVDDIKHPNMDASTHFISRYWSMSSSGLTPTSYSVTGTYLAVDINGTESSSQSNQWDGTAWSNGGAPIGGNSMTIGGCTTLPATNHFSAGQRDREINIVQGATTYLTGSTYNFGTVITTSPLDVTFTIQNTGQQNLALGASPTVAGATYSLFTNYASTTVAPISGSIPGTQTFTIRFAPSGAGTFTGSVTVTSNDSNEASYVINFTGVGQLPAPEINIQGLGNTIAPGNTPVATDNTLFAAQNIGSTSAANTFTIQNLGTAALVLSGSSPYVTLGGANPGDFAISAIPSNSVGPSSSTTFSITFSPTASGTRNATVTVTSNDSDEGTYTFNIRGDGTCVAITISTVTPSSGPEGTDVIITSSSGSLLGTTVKFNTVSATIISSSATQLVVTVPTGATSGNINITNTITGCVTSTPFTVINVTGTCAGLNELIMTEFYDANVGSLGYMEVYNGTGSAINLSNYFIRRYTDNANYLSNTAPTDYYFSPGITSISNAQVIYGKVSTDADVASPNFSYTNAGFAGINGADVFVLYNGSTIVDVFEVPNATSETGYTSKRKTTTSGPNLTLAAAASDWTNTNTESTADLGTFGYVIPPSTVPTVTTDPVDVSTCNSTATFTVAATLAPGPGSLTYQWYYNSGTATGWTAVAAASFTGVVASNFTTNTLTIAGAIGALNGYQFYCQVTQNGTCNAASDAAQLTVNAATWNGSAWVGGTPSLTVGAIIDGTYDTAVNGSFEACSVTINPSKTLTIKTGNYVSIQNDLFVSNTGSLIVQNNGSLVMISDSGVVTNNGTTQVIRTTTPYERYDYTYWSSPVNNANITSTFTGWRTDYSFEFNTANFSDVRTINSAVGDIAGSDSFDDYAPWAWLASTGAMTNGKGYAIMGPTSVAFTPTATSTVTFSGKVNNGVITIPVTDSANASNANDDYNLIGNPYPSSIFADTFITTNGAKTSGTLYFWTHVGNVSASNPGPDAYNFISDDYAVYNMSGGTRASLTGSSVPTGYVASGQGFFVEAQGNNTLTFNNAMRNKTYSNSNFYRTSSASLEKDRIWLNLQNADGMFGQQLIAYFDEASLDFDWAYDGRVNQSNNYVSFYSIAGDEKYKIQARPTFADSDIVPLGYFSAVSGPFTISIDQKEGVLDSDNTSIYLEDLDMHIIHNLKEAPYTFTTTRGRYENRFLLRYTNNSLSSPDFETLNNSVVVTANNGQLGITSNIETIKDVIVYDVLGRQLFEAKGINNNTFLTSNISMSQQALIVKITLENGMIVTRKIIL